ncbi:MAG: hypothetical protein PHF37_01065 [Phycisphaerae bacterium]|nr:hypothetical protein [Phycisphaerae bacterium]
MKLLKTTILSILIMVCLTGKTFAADDALMKMLPGDCTFCVRVNDLGGSLTKMDQYLTGVAPVSTAMLVNQQLMAITGDPMLKGVEMNGTFLIVGFSDQTAGLLIPVTNYADFIKTSPNFSKTEGEITILSSPSSHFAMTEFAGGKYALAVKESEKDKLAGMKTALTVSDSNSLAAKLNAAQAAESATAPAWAYVNLSLLYDKFSPMIMAQMEKAKQDMSTAKGGAMAKFGAFYINMYMETFKQFAGDVDSATVAITPEMTALTIDTTLRAKDGCELAQMLVADPNAKDGFAYTGYLDNSNAVNGLMKMDYPSMSKMYDKMFDIMENCKDSNSLSPQITKIKELTNKMLPAMGDEVAFSFSYAKGTPPFKFQEVIAIKDKTALEEATNEAIGLAEDFYAAMGIPMNVEYKPNIATYKNAAIGKMVLSVPLSDDPNDPTQAMMEKMYGGNLTYTTAISEDKFYVVMGPDSEVEIKALIDKDASAVPMGETKAAIDLLGNTSYNDFVCSVNIIKLMNGFIGLMQAMVPTLTDCDGNPLPMRMNIFADINNPTQSSLAIGGKIADGQIGTRIVLPKQHLMEIFGAVMQIQQKMMMQHQQQQPTPAPAPSDANQ